MTIKVTKIQNLTIQILIKNMGSHLQKLKNTYFLNNEAKIDCNKVKNINHIYQKSKCFSKFNELVESYFQK